MLPYRLHILYLTAMAVAPCGCLLEKIDRILDGHGVTHASSSSDSGETTAAPDSTTTTGSSSTDTSTSSGGSLSGDAFSDSSSGSTDEGSGESSSTGTTEPAPVCGDGVVEGDETCDDMNDDPADGCKACARDSVVFISSVRYKGYDLDGLAGADQRCRMLAAIAGLLRFETYRAWLSTSSIPAASRLRHSRGRYVLVNGLVVAQDWDALTSGTLENPIVVDENSETRDYLAWTGTHASGQPALGSEFCKDWDDGPTGSPWGGYGFSGVTDATWSYFEDGPCDAAMHIYCIEQ